MVEKTPLENILQTVKDISANKEHSFNDFKRIDNFINEQNVKSLLHDILIEVSHEDSAEKKPFLDNNYFFSQGDFNLALTFTSGLEDISQSSTLCANEFDLLAINICNRPVEVPLLRTKINTQNIYQEPQAAEILPAMSFAPYKSYVFNAFTEIPLFDLLQTVSCFLTVHSLPRTRVTWLYDRKTWNPKQLVASRVIDSRSQLAAQILPQLSRDSKIAETLNDVSRDPSQAPFVRWEALKSLCELDSEQSIHVLQTLKSDKDLYLKRLAQETLRNLVD